MKRLFKIGIVVFIFVISLNITPVAAKSSTKTITVGKSLTVNKTYTVSKKINSTKVTLMKKLPGDGSYKKVTGKASLIKIATNKKKTISVKVTPKKAGTYYLEFKWKYKKNKKNKSKKKYVKVIFKQKTNKKGRKSKNKKSNKKSTSSAKSSDVDYGYHLPNGTPIDWNDWSLSWKEKYSAIPNESGVCPWDIEVLNKYSAIEHRSNSYCLYWGDSWESISFYTKEEFDKMMNQIKYIVKEAGIKDGQTDQEKAFRIFRYFGYYRDNTPILGKEITHTLKDFLINRTGACDGTCKAYSVVLRYIGLDCEYVANRMTNHAENIVKIGNYWYWCDTWNCTDVKNEYENPVIYSGLGKLMFLYGNNPQGGQMFNIEKTDPFYARGDWKNNHPLDEYGYGYRCRVLGKTFMTWEELMALPMK